MKQLWKDLFWLVSAVVLVAAACHFIMSEKPYDQRFSEYVAKECRHEPKGQSNEPLTQCAQKAGAEYLKYN